MTVDDLTSALERFVAEKRFTTRGALAVGILVTERARDGLPIDPTTLLTPGGGQVSGLGPTVLNSVLRRNGIDRPLSKMAGRSNRATPTQMQAYVSFLNERHELGRVDLDLAESFWIGRVLEKLAARPMTLQLDTSQSLRTIVRDIISQAEQRDAQAPGTRYAGAVLQHLVGAKLACALNDKITIEHYSYSVADEHSGRAGDFVVQDTAIHVTTAPSEHLIERCRENLNDGMRPIIVTTSSKKGVSVAEGLAFTKGLADRIDVFEAEQFIALNLYELGGFADNSRRVVIADLVKQYNVIVEKVETDPAMLIAIKKRGSGLQD
ncbi:DUF4928 family protein [Nocardia sp. R6R-6]|uniref:DUF4928 family protein n=1 Tax=Nocardia sp. R6R-6 TaxID=3459303 RepID=UPI00403D9C01